MWALSKHHPYDRLYEASYAPPSQIKLIDISGIARQVGDDLYNRMIGDDANLYPEVGCADVDWRDVESVVQAQPDGTVLYAVIARYFDPYNMVAFGVLEIHSKDDYDAMRSEMDRLRASWKDHFGRENPFSAQAGYSLAPKGLLEMSLPDYKAWAKDNYRQFVDECIDEGDEPYDDYEDYAGGYSPYSNF